MDATVTIWVGVTADDINLEDLKNMLPSEFKDSDGDLNLWGDEEEACIKKHGFTLTEVFCLEEACGIGIELLRHDWGYGPKPLDMWNLTAIGQQSVHKLQSLMTALNIEVEVKTYVQTDYS